MTFTPDDNLDHISGSAQDSNDSKYSKYSTEQLEVILPHLTDSKEKELVKAELTKRYYHHYINITEKDDLTTEPKGSDIQEEAHTIEAGVDSEDDIDKEKLDDIAIDNIVSNGKSQTINDEIGDHVEATANNIDTTTEKDKPDTTTKDKKKYCFLATAAFGSPLANEVVLLKLYRDNYLSRHLLGRKFIDTYYRYSPYLARRISRNKSLKIFTRWLLTPAVLLLKTMRYPRVRP